MRKITLLFIVFALPICYFSSCIKDEPLYREADIEAFSLNNEIMVSAVISQQSILVTVTDTTNIMSRKFKPQIQISPGAVISPSVDDSIQFTNYMTVYKVVSEDRLITKLYTIEVAELTPLIFDFEDWTEKYLGLKKYPVLNDVLWNNANAGLAIAVPSNYVYPTRPTTDSHTGSRAALLETKEGVKVLGIGANIVAGSLFRGDFVMTTPVAESAKLGQIYPQLAGKPQKMTGYYKYYPGDVFVDKDNNIIDKTDRCAIYAVLFKVSKGNEGLEEYLTSSTVETSDKIIARAILADGDAKPEYTYFSLDFVYTEQPDYDRYNYKLAIVFSSSKDGDLEQGAIGSKLIIDHVEIETEHTAKWKKK